MRRPRVAVLVETSSEYGRKLLRGLARYLVGHGPWELFVEERALDGSVPAWLAEWQGDGILSRVTTPALLRWAHRRAVALVDLTDRYESSAAVQIRSDDDAIGALAADHLRERGLTQLAVVGYSGETWSARRSAGFAARVGSPVPLYETPWQPPTPWHREQAALGVWLSRLSIPLGIFATNDVRGRQVMDACRAVDLAVPEHVAVIGVDDDAVIGGLCDPPLSSVVPDPETIGFRASELLAEAMSRRTTTPSSEEIAPTGLVARGSTDVIALADPRLARAVQTIRMHACGPLVVTRVAHAAGMSRSVLERGFRQVLGISPQTLIRRTRLREVMVLLRDTELSLRDIAQRTGFKHAEHLCTVFKRERDETPGQYRKSSRRRPSTPLLAFAAKDRRPRD